MKRVQIKTLCPVEDVMTMMADHGRVNEGLTFDSREGTPTLRIKQKPNGRLHMRCVLLGGHTKDNGYIQGTFFTGRIREGADGKTELRGWIMTEPVFHLIWLALIVAAVVQMIDLGGISVTPLLLIPFVYIMFRGEYRKQEYLRRYIYRAVHRLEKTRK